MYDLNFIGNNSKEFEIKESKTFLLTQKTLDINIKVSSRVILAGSKMDVKIKINNYTTKIGSNCSLKLIQHVLYHEFGSIRGYAKIEIHKIQIGQIDQKEVKNLENTISLPKYLCESIEKSKIIINNKEINIGRILTVSYYVKLKFKKLIVKFSL
jgi:hypothetical protein